MVTCVRMCNEFWRHNNSETGQTEQSDSLEMNRMCKIGTKRREMRKIQRATFFLTPGILMRFLAKKCENIAKSRQKMIPVNGPIFLDSYVKGPIFPTSWYMHIFFAQRFFEAAYPLGII